MAMRWPGYIDAEFQQAEAMTGERPVRTRLSMVVVADAFDAAVVSGSAIGRE